MPTNVDDIIRKLSPALRKKVEARAAQLIAEEMTLRELRHARKLTQVRMAKTLGITQDGVSRLEKRSDLLLSTLRKSVEAMGGECPPPCPRLGPPPAARGPARHGVGEPAPCFCPPHQFAPGRRPSLARPLLRATCGEPLHGRGCSRFNRHRVFGGRRVVSIPALRSSS